LSNSYPDTLNKAPFLFSMSGTPEHVHNLTDAELYQELLKHGFPAGPVVG
jgi:LEM domain.